MYAHNEDWSTYFSYDADNHDTMVRLRQAKVDAIAKTIPDLVVDGRPCLVVGGGAVAARSSFASPRAWASTARAMAT
mgnify:CR=1 FL=1